MPLVSIPFLLRQRFPFSTRAVNDGSTDDQPGDIALWKRLARELSADLKAPVSARRRRGR